MNQEPIHSQTDPVTPQQPVEQPPVAPVPPVQPVAVDAAPRGGAGLAITSMVLGIVSIVIFFLWFVAIPLAITAIILGIVSLVKRYPGKGMSITGIVTGGVGAFILGGLVLLSLVAYSGITERANEAQREYEQSQRQKELFR